MDSAISLLATLGPVGVLAAGLVAVVAWVARVSLRLDNLDHEEKGRVPRVERRVDDVVSTINDLHTDVEVIKNDTQWIRGTLSEIAPATAAKRTRKVDS